MALCQSFLALHRAHELQYKLIKEIGRSLGSICEVKPKDLRIFTA